MLTKGNCGAETRADTGAEEYRMRRQGQRQGQREGEGEGVREGGREEQRNIRYGDREIGGGRNRDSNGDSETSRHVE